MSKYIKKEWDENVVKYFKEIVKYKLLTPERELELAIRVRNGDDDEAFEELVTSNLRFVISMAKEYQGQGLGQEIVSHLIDLSKKLGCYKCILNCDVNLIKFYQKCGLEPNNMQMVKYFK